MTVFPKCRLFPQPARCRTPWASFETAWYVSPVWKT